MLGRLVERQWDIVVNSWEMTGFVVSVLVTLVGFFVGSAAAMTRKVVPVVVLGVILSGVALAGMALTNGSPQGVVVWTISAAICAGAAAGTVGGVIDHRSGRES